MELTITVPENLPQVRWRQRIKELEESLRAEAKFWTAVPTSGKFAASARDDPWSNPDVELPAVDTGIEDLSLNYDDYLLRRKTYGHKKQTTS